MEVAFCKGRNVFLDGMANSYALVTIQDCSFHHSGAWGFTTRGTIGTMTVTNSHFDDNGADDPSHGIGFDLDMPVITTRVIVEGGSFSRNAAKGINLVKTSHATFTGLSATNNGGAPGGGFGACIWEWAGVTDDVVFDGCNLSNNSTDGLLVGSEGTGSVSNLTLQCCDLIGNGRSGAFFWGCLGGSISNVAIEDCNILGNPWGVYNGCYAAVVDAEDNWWGDPAGPGPVGPGAGDRVSSGVDFDPWLSTPPPCEGNVLYLMPDADSFYVRPGETCTVTLNQSGITNPVAGFQAFLSFDTSKFSIAPAAISFTAAPYGLPVYKEVVGSAIDLAAGVIPIVQPTTVDDAKLADLAFTVPLGTPDTTTTVSFRSHDPETMFTNDLGDRIPAQLINSPTIYIDGTPPVLTTVPADGATNPVSTATQTIMGTVSDALSGVDTLVYTLNGAGPYAVPVTAGAFSQTVVLAPGTNTVVFTLTDRAGNTATSTIVYEYSQPAPTVDVYASLAPNKYAGGSSWSLWQANAVEGAKTQTSPYGTGYAEFRDLAWATQDFASCVVTGFKSWLAHITTDNEWGTATQYVYRIDNRVQTNPGAAKLSLDYVRLTHLYVYKGADDPAGDTTFDFSSFAQGTIDSGQFLAGNQKLKGFNWDGAQWVEVTSGREADVIICVWDRIGQDPQTGTTEQERLNNLYKQLSGAIVNPDTAPHRTHFYAGNYRVQYTGHGSVGDADSGLKEIKFEPLNDATDPVVTVTSPVDLLETNNPSLTIMGTATDNEDLASGIREVRITLNSVEVYANTTEDDVSFSQAVTLAEGTNTIVVTAKDFAGNTTTVTRTVILDTQPPTVSIDSAVQNAIELLISKGSTTNAIQGTVTITVSASDLGDSGLVTPPVVKVKDAADVETTLVASGSGPWTYDYIVTASTANGVATITANVSDEAGNTAQDIDTFNINKSQATVTVELESVRTDITRWIKFTIGGTGGPVSPVTMVRQVSFTWDGNPAHNAVGQIILTDLSNEGAWTRISAKDEQHTLRQAVNLAPLGDNQFSASFTGADMLIGGDLTNDNLVDIRDFGVYAGQYGASPDLGTAWPVRNANIDCVAPVDTPDFSYIQIHFLDRGDDQVGGTSIATLNVALTSITVAELAKIAGFREARRADVDANGIVNATDVRLFVEKYMTVKRGP